MIGKRKMRSQQCQQVHQEIWEEWRVTSWVEGHRRKAKARGEEQEKENRYKREQQINRDGRDSDAVQRRQLVG